MRCTIEPACEDGERDEPAGRDALRAAARRAGRDDVRGAGPGARRRAPVEAILAAQARCGLRTQFDGLLAFRPAIDGRALPAPPIDAIRDGLSREVAVIAGYTRDEWKLFSFMDPQAQKLDEAGLRARMELRAPGRGPAIIEAYRALLGAGAKPFELFCAIEYDTNRRMAMELGRRCQPLRIPDDALLRAWDGVL